MSQSCLVASSSSCSTLCRLVSFAAVIRVVTQRSSPLTAAHSSSGFLSLKLTNKKQASIFWKPGPSPSRYLKTNMADLSSAFSEVCKKFEFSDLNQTQKEVLTQVVLKKKDIFVSLSTGFGESVIFQALPIVFDSYTGKSSHIVIQLSRLCCY